MECKAWVDECSAKCVEEEDEKCSDDCKKILAEHEVRCLEECSAVGWEYGEVVVEEIPRHWVNCTHRNASYCQYRFLLMFQVAPGNRIVFCSFSYELDTWGKDGPEKVKTSIDLCFTI